MSADASNILDNDPVMERLEDQIGWYDHGSRTSQRIFKLVKTVEILAAATIPFLASIDRREARWATAALGVMITILEGLLHLNQYQQNWIAYRSTCESLKHEKYIFLAQASPYANSPNARALLAERVESLVSQEHAKWVAAQQQEKPKAD
jgi:Protein of unknown function (DUF4231)